MQVIELSYPLSLSRAAGPEAGQVMAIGDFDGVHLGHREVIRKAVETAKQRRVPVSVMTFHPHPREVLGQGRYTHYLSPLEDKLDAFRELGIDYVYLVHFNLAFSQVTAEQFVTEMLLPLGLDTVVVGFDFAFGHQARGNADTLCEWAKGQFVVEVVRPFHLDGEKVSSTLIRRCLEDGHVDHARQLLGRHYQLSGTVIHGDARGRTIGFPTANLQLNGAYVIPVNGVYAVQVNLDGVRYGGVMNLGTKPTFSDGSLVRTFEVHIFDFNQMIYGAKLLVELVSYIRPERKFGSIDELVAQIHLDVETAKGILLRLT
ncbi:bifunctional riboflavin kinase/FAD synthetase [Paenibacillus sp. HJGM_3]|uniref:bifunctional riboflavin kinase/FAD synthetase n=1 Tax=Paenibacillus sp. HJGM_3 TaxID=3379816 RepID=UPI00385E6BA3